MDAKTMRKVADNIRILEAAMVEKAKSGHPGGSMSGTDYVNTLYSKYIVYDPDDAKWFARDRFFLDPGHMSPMLYGVLAMCGKFLIEDLKNLRQWGSVTPGHPEVDVCRGIENGSGPLGQGHAMAVGAAIAERFIAARFGEVVSHKTYAFISDGGVQEEISQGAGRLAGYLGLSNLIMFYDSNKVQLATMVDDVTSEDTAAKYRAWNWNVIEIDGNDSDEICKALDQALKEDERPTLIIGNTVMGKGCVDADGNSFEFKCSTHGNPLSKSGASYEMTVKNLGGNPEDPWAVFEETKALYAARKEELKAIVAERRAKFDAWAKENPEDAAELQSWIDGKLPEIDYKAIAHKPNIATRASSADVLTVLGEKVKNMIVSSADLSNSDKTEAFLKKAGSVIAPDNYGGKFLQSGVAELTMATVMNGIALHGGLLCACGTFFVFSDYMKPAIRMTALMQLPVKYVWTHDSFRVGEDGPKVKNMIVSSADLSNSDKTEAFLKKAGSVIAPDNYGGKFLQSGVAELTMATVMNGIALHGGLLCACGTFFVFSDYMKPAIRMTALMQLPVKYVWTHDSFRVGEDGPTHQPVEQEAQIRLMEELKNHSGKNSMLVLRPADSAETTVAWKMAMENVDSPTGLILTRQDVEDLPSAGGDRYADALQMLKGGYAVVNCEKPDVVLVGNGSDVMLLVKAAEQLKEEGVNARVVSVPSIGLFMSQEDGYRKALIPDDVPTYGKTSGIPSTLLRVVGSKGKISGLDHFGYSAPYKLLEEKFGFTVDAVLAEIRDLLK